MITIKCKNKVAEQLMLNELMKHKDLEVSLSEDQKDISIIGLIKELISPRGSHSIDKDISHDIIDVTIDYDDEGDGFDEDEIMKTFKSIISSIDVEQGDEEFGEPTTGRRYRIHPKIKLTDVQIKEIKQILNK